MSSTTKTFLLTYMCLVLVPVLSLLLILRQGKSLKAPISVAGSWTLQVDSVQVAGLPCGKAIAETLRDGFTIVQSGGQVILHGSRETGGTTFGVLEGNNLKASMAPSQISTHSQADENGCSSERRLNLQATVETKARPRTLAGVLSVSGCDACMPVDFRAVRSSIDAMEGED